jgi:putative ABC transport system permease protein
VAAGAIAAELTVYGAQWITSAIPADNRQYLRNQAVLPVDLTVVAFAIGMGIACGLLFGWLPAWTGTAGDVNRDLRDGAGRASTGRKGTRIRSALVIGEIALSLALLIAAVLLVETGRNVTHADVGFDARSLVTFDMALDARQYREPPTIRDFYERLVAELVRQPGVSAAAAGSLVPFGQEGRGTELFFEGQPDPKPADTPVPAFSQITSGYAETLGLRLRRGRVFRQADDSQAPRVALINETLASRYFTGLDPIGRRVRINRSSQDFWRIVGVVADVKNFETTDPARPQVYVPLAQSPSRRMTLVVRSLVEPERLAGTIRSAVAAVDPSEPIAELMTMEMRIFRVTGPYQVVSTFVTFFGVVTLLLAGVGVYGVISYSFAQRTREIGIRMALGARRANVASLVFGQIRTLLVCGLIPGMAMGWLFAQTLSAILYGVGPSDWRLYLGMSALLSAVALLAALAPARRATRIEPMTALRE